MLPHSIHGFADSGLPDNLPYFLTLSGYMLIFFVEKVAFDAHHIMNDGGGGHDHGSASVTDGKSEAGGEVAPSGRSATILLVALGVHALMETMALGLSSNKLSAGLLAMSIGLHQVGETEREREREGGGKWPCSALYLVSRARMAETEGVCATRVPIVMCYRVPRHKIHHGRKPG